MNPGSCPQLSFTAGFYGVETRAGEMSQAGNHSKVGKAGFPGNTASLPLALISSALLLSSRKVGRATNNGPKLPQR